MKVIGILANAHEKPEPVPEKPPRSEKLSDTQVQEIIQDALAQAHEATRSYLALIGGDQYPCGFAWVKIKPARGQFVRILKSMGVGRTDSYYGGYLIYPSNFCQNMDAKAAGCEALVNVLKKHGVKAHVVTRID